MIENYDLKNTTNILAKSKNSTQKKFLILLISILLILILLVISLLCRPSEPYLAHNISYQTGKFLPDHQSILFFSKDNPDILSLSFPEDFTLDYYKLVDIANKHNTPLWELSDVRQCNFDHEKHKELLLQMETHLKKFTPIMKLLAVSDDRTLYAYLTKDWGRGWSVKLIRCKTTEDREGNKIPVSHIADVGSITGIAFDFESAVFSPDNRFLLTVVSENKSPHKGRKSISIWKIGN